MTPQTVPPDASGDQVGAGRETFPDLDLSNAELDLRALGEEQEALRRIATLVASGATPEDVFGAVAESVAAVLDVPAISMIRFGADGTVTKVAAWGDELFPVGTTWTLDEASVMAAVRETSLPARIDYTVARGEYAQAIRAAGLQSAVGAPIVVEGEVWGVIVAFSPDRWSPSEKALTPIARFTELVGAAIANAQARNDLHQLAAEQAALRRVATLVARQAAPAEIFERVAEEARVALELPLVAIARYEADDSFVIVGATGDDHPFVTGSRFPLDPGVSSAIRETRRPARADYDVLPGSVAEAARKAGLRTALGVPIVVEGELWGTISALSTVTQPLPADAEARLVEFTELVGTAISNADAYEEMRRLAGEQAALRRVAVLVAEGASPNDVFAAVAEEVAHLLDVPAISMVRFETDETSTAVAVWGDGNPFGVGATFEPWPGVMLQVRQTGRSARLEDFAYSTGPTTERLQVARIHSGVGVPITVEGRVWGTIIALATEGAALPVGIEARLYGFTELVATAIANAQGRDDLTAFVREQEALRRVATLVAQEATPEEVFAAVAEEIVRVLDLPRVEMARYEPDGTTHVLGAAGEHPFQPGTEWPLDGPTISTLVRDTGRAARIDDYSTVPGTIAQAVREAGIRSGLGIPILVGGKVWGMVATGTTDAEPLPAQTEARLGAFTELIATAIANANARDDVRRLAEEQASLRRVATLVAEGTSPAEVFAAVATEVAEVTRLPLVEIARFDPDGMSTVVGAAGEHPFQPGTRWPLDNPTGSDAVRRTRQRAVIEYTDQLPGLVAAAAREAGLRWAVGVPIVVDGEVWGSIGVSRVGDEPLPNDAESRLVGFTELVATTVSNATTHSQLLASRARIVAAGDEARRRIERDLHDGTQQRLVSLGLDIQTLRATIPAGQPDALQRLLRLERDVESLLDEVRELSRGLHPPLLTQRGLGPALRALARRSPAPVEVDLSIDTRPSEAVEIATYYVVSEALANAAKHAGATQVSVSVSATSTHLRAQVTDNGGGGADSSKGSGLIGLIDRVEALGGRLVLDSRRGSGTQISIELPLSDQEG